MPDFNACLEKINAMTDNGLSPSSNPIFAQNFSKPGMLTVAGCLKACGGSYDRWPLPNVLQRFTMWIIPALLLVANFAFPALGFLNKLCVIYHLIGDPIDSIYSLLSTMECLSQIYRDVTLSETIEDRDKPYLRVLRMAHFELVCGDVSCNFCAAPKTVILTDQEALSSDSKSATKLIKAPNLRDKGREKLKSAASIIVGNRVDMITGTYIALAVLGISMVSAYVRIKDLTSRIDNEVAHTIAAMTLLYFLIPLVLISGTMGTYNSPLVPLRELRKISFEYPNLNAPWDPNTSSYLEAPTIPIALFSLSNPSSVDAPSDLKELSGPRASSGVNAQPRFDSRTQATATDEEEFWMQNTAWKVMNNCWLIPPHGIRKRKLDCYAYSIATAFVLLGSCLPAVLLAATNRTTVGKIGFGCRSLTWCCIGLFWVISSVLDIVFRSFWGSSPKMWTLIRVKDVIATFVVASSVFVLEYGFYNNCWCRANVIYLHNHAVVNLFPMTAQELVKAWKLWISVPVAALVLNLALTGALIYRYWDVRQALYMRQKRARTDVQASSAGSESDSHDLGPLIQAAPAP